MYDRRGSLFLDNLKRKKAHDEEAICRITHYIHYNPVHHKFVKKMTDWEHSSYHSYLNQEETWLAKEETFAWFGGMAGFEEYHRWEPNLDPDPDPQGF